MHRFSGRLFRGSRVRIRITREAMERGYKPCKDNTIAIFLEHHDINGREMAELHLPSGAHVKMSYDHIAEIIVTEYETRKEELLNMALKEQPED